VHGTGEVTVLPVRVDEIRDDLRRVSAAKHKNRKISKWSTPSHDDVAKNSVFYQVILVKLT
jgi:hypothetical protein